MAGAMRKVGEYLGLVEQADFDEYDDEPTGPVPAVRREEERTPAVRGTINRVTSKVFLLSPENIEVTDEDKQRIAAGGFYNNG